MKTPWGALALILVACGGSVREDGDEPLDAGPVRDARRDVARADVQDAIVDQAAAFDSYQRYQEDACGDVVIESPSLDCDPFQQPSTCPAGQGCYPVPPHASDRCHPGRYATRCFEEGTGTQGTPCAGGSECAGGFICVKSSVGDQCVRLCQTNVYGTCGEGRICVEVDVTGSGWGGCL